MASDMRVAILGSGWWHRTRGGPAHVVSFGDTNVMFDCGRKAVSRLFRVGIPPAEVSALFISHSHFDHNMSLVEFLFGSWLTGRTEPVPVYGPKGTAALIEALVGPDGFYARDIASRTDGSVGMDPGGIEVLAADVETPGIVHEGENWKVTAAAVPHSPFLDAWAYRLDTEQGSVAYSGDTAPSDEMIRLAQGADLLIHECTATEEIIREKGLGDFHTSSTEVGRIASEAGVRMVAIVHFGGNGDATGRWAVRRMAREVRRGFKGKVFVGGDPRIIRI